ncbi:MAG: helix-turn-helix domain-containing protein [Kofleriaceae bacterium]
MRRRFDREACAIARSLEILGDWWTLLLVRDAFLGVRRFVDFQARLGISKNILTRRLAHLVEHGVLETVDAGVHGTRYEYHLTAKGKDLLTTVTALRQWGDRWVFGAGHEPLVVVDRRTGRPVPPVRILDEDGAPLPGSAMDVRPGPGAPARNAPAAPRKPSGTSRKALAAPATSRKPSTAARSKSSASPRR